MVSIQKNSQKDASSIYYCFCRGYPENVSCADIRSEAFRSKNQDGHKYHIYWLDQKFLRK